MAFTSIFCEDARVFRRLLFIGDTDEIEVTIGSIKIMITVVLIMWSISKLVVRWVAGKVCGWKLTSPHTDSSCSWSLPPLLLLPTQLSQKLSEFKWKIMNIAQLKLDIGRSCLLPTPASKT